MCCKCCECEHRKIGPIVVPSIDVPIKFNISDEMRGLILSVVKDATERGLLDMPKE